MRCKNDTDPYRNIPKRICFPREAMNRMFHLNATRSYEAFPVHKMKGVVTRNDILDFLRRHAENGAAFDHVPTLGELLTLNEAMERTGFTARRLRAHLARQRVPFYRFSQKNLMIPLAALDAAINGTGKKKA